MKNIFIVTFGLLLITTHANAQRVSCKSFKTQSQAQTYYNAKKAKSLDRDGDGRACDCLPGGSGKNCPKKKK